MSNSGTYDYVVVGSGAGGGTVAARLAERGRKVLVLEAGGDPRTLEGGDAAYPNDNRLPDDYDVPVFHASSTENAAMKWDYWVRHFENQNEQEKDLKWRDRWPEPNGAVVNGVWYPRAGCLGGRGRRKAGKGALPGGERAIKNTTFRVKGTEEPPRSS